MKTYTLIAYRPDSADVCRGQVMSGSPSDCHIFVSDNRETLINEYAKYVVKNAEAGREYAEYELTLLVNGRGVNDVDAPDEDFDDIPHMAHLRATRILNDRRVTQAAIHRSNMERMRQATEQQERQEFERLKSKYGSPS